MRTRVLLFAALREAAGTRELQLELPAGASVQRLKDEVAAAHPVLARLLVNAAVALNEEYVPGDRSIHDGDTVALIPPVSGGQHDL